MPDTTYFFNPVTVRQGEEFTLRNREYDHVVKALRKSEGEQISIANGNGMLIRSEIVEIGSDQVRCRAIDLTEAGNELPVKLTLAVGLIRQKRFEWMVEKATELGVRRIQPLYTDRVVRSGFRQDRLEKKAVAAMKQSERAVLPEIGRPVELDRWLSDIDSSDVLVASQMPGAGTLADHLADSFSGTVTVAIGPEGGWSEEERERFRTQRFPILSLGRRRLRTETAAVAVTSQLSLLYENSRESRREQL